MTTARRGRAELPVPRSHQGTVVNRSAGGFTVTSDGTDARIACDRCSMIAHTAAHDRERMDEIRELHNRERHRLDGGSR